MQVNRRQSYIRVPALNARTFRRAAVYVAEGRRLLLAGRSYVTDRRARRELEVLAVFAHQLVIAIGELEHELTLELEYEDAA